MHEKHIKNLDCESQNNFSGHVAEPIYFPPEEHKASKLSDLTKIPKLVSGSFQ